MLIHKICSGGQSGADVGGLEFAKSKGLETGGWMPCDWQTEDGPKPEYEERFNLKEHPAQGYAVRTQANVRDTDGTVRFAGKFGSPGEKCTFSAIQKFGKPYFDIDVSNPPESEKFIEWIKTNNIKTLNVAGNRESTWPGIKDFVISYLETALAEQE